ncbi:MAG: GSCFA domain-containing protein [Bacteroidales bacterium]|jgi:hypothetical protein|nr:GSCFA domain-containing protein [Bacteroidales bacterium]
MIFRTEIRPKPSDFKISHAQRGLTIGSCFSDSMGNRLQDAKFPLLRNPLGVVYNPASVLTALHILSGKKTFSEVDLFCEQGIWKSYFLHSSFSSTEKSSVLENIAEVQHRFRSEFVHLDYCIVTLGTAWVYALAASGEIVSNCHKTPANRFTRRQLSVAEIFTALTHIREVLQTINPNIYLIFTISPVRHWADGAHENQVSKSRLFVALDDFLYAHHNTHYFESYELLIDDLRDYRFYEEDLLHPNSQAITYIWEQFCATYFSAETQKIVGDFSALYRAMQHRPFQRKSAEYQSFCEKYITLSKSLNAQFPHIDVSAEVSFFEKQCR